MIKNEKESNEIVTEEREREKEGVRENKRGKVKYRQPSSIENIKLSNAGFESSQHVKL